VVGKRDGGWFEFLADANTNSPVLLFHSASGTTGQLLRRLIPSCRADAASEGVISAAVSRVAIRVIRADEELMIAKTICSVLGIGRTRKRKP
jgi:hypothetical protein